MVDVRSPMSPSAVGSSSSPTNSPLFPAGGALTGLLWGGSRSLLGADALSLDFAASLACPPATWAPFRHALDSPDLPDPPPIRSSGLTPVAG